MPVVIQPEKLEIREA